MQGRVAAERGLAAEVQLVLGELDDGLSIAVLGGDHERRVAARVDCVEVGAGLDDQFDDVLIGTSRSNVQCRGEAVGADVGAVAPWVAEKQADGFNGRINARQVQGRESGAVLDVVHLDVIVVHVV